MQEILNIFKDSKSKSDVCRMLRLPINGTGLRKVNYYIEKYSIDTSHFDNGKSKKTIYVEIEKTCPVCSKIFKTKFGIKKEKTTCSNSCSNSYFKSGVNHPRYKTDAVTDYTFRYVCFEYHPKVCVYCGETNVIEVHHIDENHANNSPENLVVLCPNHHRYWHTNSLKHIVKEAVYNYINKFMENNCLKLPNKK